MKNSNPESRKGEPDVVDDARRRLMVGVGLLPAALLGCGGGGDTQTEEPPPPPPPPNMLMIVIDDLNDWVGFLAGHPQVQTPNMDRLAARSTVFKRAYCNVPLCNPSRASALSGLTPQDSKVYDNFTSPLKANPSAVQLHTYIGTKSYTSKTFGKINHVYSSVPMPAPETLPATNLKCSGYPDVKPEGLFDWAPMPQDDSAMPDYQYAQSGIDFLAQPQEKPFFLGVGFVHTHLSWYVPQRYFDLYPEDSVHVPDAPADDLDDLPQEAKDLALAFNAHNCITRQGLWASAVRAQLAAISFIDAQIGRLLDALDTSAHAGNTAVVLWSDNGFHLGEKFHWHKQALWEHTTRVPFLVSMPGQTAGSVVESPVSLLDMMPTVLDICGIAEPYPLAGRTLRPLLNDPLTPWNHPVLITNAEMDSKNQYADGTFDYAIRDNQWRYIRYYNGGRELYDETVDPAEYRNLAGDASYEPIMASLDAMMPPIG